VKMLNVLALVAGLIPVSANAQEDSAFVTFKTLKPEVAMRLAVAAMENCRENGSQVGVAVVDRFGVLQVFVRDRFAGAHSIETATRKAWTAVSFRTDTLTLDEVTGPDSVSYGIRFISKALPLGGGVLVESAGSIVAGVGVSGAPDPAIDDDCARAGIEAIDDVLGF
jgi:uncharacterized protein GlcG (DUF336 family)